MQICNDMKRRFIGTAPLAMQNCGRSGSDHLGDLSCSLRAIDTAFEDGI
jgi:hypothetical protein